VPRGGPLQRETAAYMRAMSWRRFATTMRSTTMRSTTMKIIEHTIDIEATAGTTWAVLNDFAAYSDWNPFMTVDGTIAATGDRPIITIRPGKRTMTFRPTITNIEAGRSIAWLGHLLLPGVFDGAHE